MKRTRLNLLPRVGAARSFDARGFQHGLYLEECEARLKKTLSHAVGWTLFRFVRIRRKHPAYQGRPLRRASQNKVTSETHCLSVSFLEIEIADADGAIFTRELTGEEREAALEKWRRGALL